MAKEKELIEETHFHEGSFEYVSSEPLFTNVKMPAHMSEEDTIRAIIRSEQFASAARAAGAETFEESEDFDVGDDYDPTSPWEEQFDPETGLGRYDPEYLRHALNPPTEPDQDAGAGAGASPPAPAPDPDPAPEAD